ncbi:ornithine cyclodeaminase family protein [Ktedonosporobacter rubrisoli]|uniref:Ornithine cyclodeaminase family protein n=1 Tax=Ktedonosporobacter rubrisoli TaxID=2509675 RepID=A0A4P6JIU1_KTERU|nr:ornithine cyclodeaminase family protein [Ktedonosporobacter rubrisoli]QBD74830.1 ornithine cyclodeaminase family protein [Ktedonosporobacter rubrisoli]
MTTILLTRSEIEPLLQISELLPPLREAFRAYSSQRTISAQRARTPLPGEQAASAVLLFPGLIPGIPAYTVKVHAKFPQQSQAIQGVILLHDLQTGQLLATMDSTAITAMRTGLAGALAADILARPTASRVAIIGAGAQGKLQLRCLSHVRRLSHVHVYDLSEERARQFAHHMQTAISCPLEVASTLEDAIEDAEIIISATWSRSPFIMRHMLQSGTHITTLGPDEPGKCEVEASVIEQGLFVCDDRELAVTMGAIGGAGLGAEAIHAELGEIIAGTRQGRSIAEQITIYGGVGLAFQDLAVCWHIYQQLRERGAQSIDFLA